MYRAALSGVKVLDLSRLVAGNMATLQLADFGADVIKVEQPGIGDPLRQWRKDNIDLWWREYGRNKRSLALDIKTPRGQELLLSLIRQSDILVENFVPGKLEELGLPHSRFLEENPRVVILSISAWGQDGPYSNRPGFGTLVEAMSGFASMLGFADRPPTLPPIPIGDMIAGIYGAFASLAALRYRDMTGEGQVIDLSLLEALYSILGPVAGEYKKTGRYPTRNGNRSPNSSPRNTYLTADKKWIALSASTPRMAEKLFRLIGLGDLLDDDRFATNEARVRNGDETDRIVALALAKFTLAELMQRFVAAGVAGAPVYDIPDVLADPHVAARGVLTQFSDPELGPWPMHTPLPRMSLTPGKIRRQGPKLGEHSSVILQENLGLTAKEIMMLMAEGVISQ